MTLGFIEIVSVTSSSSIARYYRKFMREDNTDDLGQRKEMNEQKKRISNAIGGINRTVESSSYAHAYKHLIQSESALTSWHAWESFDCPWLDRDRSGMQRHRERTSWNWRTRNWCLVWSLFGGLAWMGDQGNLRKGRRTFVLLWVLAPCVRFQLLRSLSEIINSWFCYHFPHESKIKQ